MAYQNKKPYGKIFRELRESKEMKQSDFEILGVSKMTISNFEKGKSFLPINILDSALELMCMSLTEYEYLVNDFRFDIYEDAFLRIEHAFYKGDERQLRGIAAEFESDNLRERVISLGVKGIFRALAEEEKQKISDFLFLTEIWGIYELSLFLLILPHLESDLILSFIKDLGRKNHHLEKIFKYRRRIQQILARAAVTFSQRGEKKAAWTCLDYAHQIFYERDLFTRNAYLFTRGYYRWVFEDKKKGVHDMKEALWIFEELECQDLTQYYQKAYRLLIGKK